jgi:hypothetical protein
MRLGIAAGLAGLCALALSVSASAEQKSDEETFKLMKTETIGALRIGAPEAEVKRAIGAPPARTGEIFQAADARFVQRWSYARQGLTLRMGSDKKGAPKEIDAIDCAARCTLKTTRGIGIGSTLADVQKAYSADFNKEESKLPELFVAGTIYGGLLLKFKGGKVGDMFLGAAAE